MSGSRNLTLDWGRSLSYPDQAPDSTRPLSPWRSMMNVESEEEEDEGNLINCSSSSYERSFSEEEEEKKSGSSEVEEDGREGAGNRGYYKKEGKKRYFGQGNGDRVLVRVDSTESEDYEDDAVMSLKSTNNRLEELTRSMTHPSASNEDPLRKVAELQDNRRMTLPAMMVTPYSGTSSSSSEDVAVPGTLPNRTGFRRRARRRKMNSRNSVPCGIPLTRPERPLSAGHKADTLDTLSALPRAMSRSTGNLLEEDDPVYKSPSSFMTKSPQHSITQSVSPSPRRRSSLLVALSGMLSKSQSNLLDVGEEVLPIKVIRIFFITLLFNCFFSIGLYYGVFTFSFASFQSTICMLYVAPLPSPNSNLIS